MDSLNSLLIGFYTLLSYSYSQRHTYLTLGSWKRNWRFHRCTNALDGYHVEKRKGKKIFSFSRASSRLSSKCICTATYSCLCCVLCRQGRAYVILVSDMWGQYCFAEKANCLLSDEGLLSPVLKLLPHCYHSTMYYLYVLSCSLIVNKRLGTK